jgi:hypothetical protein
MRKLGLFPSSGNGTETPTLLGPSERANLNHWTEVSSFWGTRKKKICSFPLTWRRKQIQFPEHYVFCLFRIMDDGQNS